MSIEEAFKESPLLDNPIFLDALRDVFGYTDTGTSAGFQDGLNGIPKRQHVPGTPELFIYCYDKSYIQGMAARGERELREESEANSREIAIYEKRMGHCLDSNRNNSRSVPVVQPKTYEGNQVEETPVIQAKSQQSIAKKLLGYFIACTITGVAGGLIGVMIGQKRAMKVRRDLGVTDQTGK